MKGSGAVFFTTTITDTARPTLTLLLIRRAVIFDWARLRLSEQAK